MTREEHAQLHVDDLVVIGERVGARFGDWVKVSVFNGPDTAPVRLTIQHDEAPSPQTVWLSIDDASRVVELLHAAIAKAVEP